MIYLYLSIAAVVGYLIGNINFARIFSWVFAKRDITTVGSKNPGTMNMLRTRGFGEAFLTLICEAIKAGAPAIGSYFLFEHLFAADFAGCGNWAHFIVAFSVVLGHCFPVFYKFKGGKGVACSFGMFAFHPELWWIALIVFAICFVLFLFIQFPFLVTLSCILTLTITATCLFSIYAVEYYFVLIIIMWVNFALLVFLHRGNIKRLCTGKENKVNFREKIFKKKTTESMAVASNDTNSLGEDKI